MSNSPAQIPFHTSTSAAAEDEIDLGQVAEALNRQRRVIAAVTGASLILSGIYAFTRKPVWEGQFQIVLESKDSRGLGKLASDNKLLSDFAGLAGLGGGLARELKTEVKVLMSPSVLKSTYDFVKALKEKKETPIA